MKYAILIPIGNYMSGKLIPQLLYLHEYISQIDGKIYTVSNRTHVDARNHLLTNGGGFVNSTKFINNVEWIVWIDSDQVFNIGQLKTLLDCEKQFCSGWYIKDSAGARNPYAMCAMWNEEYFKKYKSMKFLHESELLNSNKPFIYCDYVGLGFAKIHTSLIKKLEYPYFRQHVRDVGKYKDNTSEDVSFCLDIYKATKVKPAVIPSLKVGHLKEIVI